MDCCQKKLLVWKYYNLSSSSDTAITLHQSNSLKKVFHNQKRKDLLWVHVNTNICVMTQQLKNVKNEKADWGIFFLIWFYFWQEELPSKRLIVNYFKKNFEWEFEERSLFWCIKNITIWMDDHLLMLQLHFISYMHIYVKVYEIKRLLKE